LTKKTPFGFVACHSSVLLVTIEAAPRTEKIIPQWLFGKKWGKDQQNVFIESQRLSLRFAGTDDILFRLNNVYQNSCATAGVSLSASALKSL
jgi:hypothetical protein